MTTIPTLETKRLRLREHRPSDLDACAAMWSHPVVTRYIGGRPFTREEVWARLLRYAGHWLWLDFGFWVIEDGRTGRLIGEVGLAEFKRDIVPAMEEGPEAGWVLVPEAHGHGFATEALQAVTAWNDRRAGGQKLSCVIHPENSASIRVASKCGFREARRGLYKGQMTAVFVRAAGMAAGGR
jgi:RimJ/RimL family protein N-acetyltransferase